MMYGIMNKETECFLKIFSLEQWKLQSIISKIGCGYKIEPYLDDYSDHEVI